MLGPSFYQKAAYAKSYQAFKEDQDRLLLAMHGAYVERYFHYAAVPGVWGLSHPTLLNTFESKSGRRFAVMLTHRAPNLRNDYFIDDKYILDDRSILT